MGSVVSNMYGGLQYMMSCGGDNQTFPDNGRSSLAATPFVWKRTRYVFHCQSVLFWFFLLKLVFCIPYVIFDQVN